MSKEGGFRWIIAMDSNAGSSTTQKIAVRRLEEVKTGEFQVQVRKYQVKVVWEIGEQRLVCIQQILGEWGITGVFPAVKDLFGVVRLKSIVHVASEHDN